MLQIKVVQNLISYKKLGGPISLSLPVVGARVQRLSFLKYLFRNILEKNILKKSAKFPENVIG